MALLDRSMSPQRHHEMPPVTPPDRHPVSLSHRGSLRSVLEDTNLDDDGAQPPVRSSHTMPGNRPRIRALSGPESPCPLRDDFRQPVAPGVAVIFFDFDGTLTATPGDRAARRTKQLELCERAPMLQPRLRNLRTIRSALDAAELSKFFDAPLVGKAVGFEGKARSHRRPRGSGLGSTVKHGVPFSRILLVDDDLLELERAKARGVQVYAAPEEGAMAMRL
eukprot:Skav223737  [mRNA]  locus=scaffold2572:118549:123721:+ [translate_table: standard]